MNSSENISYYYIGSLDDSIGKDIFEIDNGISVNTIGINYINNIFIVGSNFIFGSENLKNVHCKTGFIAEFYLIDNELLKQNIFMLNDLETFKYFINKITLLAESINDLFVWSINQDFEELFLYLCKFSTIPIYCDVFKHALQQKSTKYFDILLDSDIMIGYNIMTFLVEYREDILKQLSENKFNKYDLENALCMSIYHNKMHLVEYFIDLGVDISKNNYSFIGDAIRENNQAIVQYLFSKINLTECLSDPKNHMRLLLAACCKNNYEMIVFLTELGFDINHRPSIIRDLFICDNSLRSVKYLIDRLNCIPENFINELLFTPTKRVEIERIQYLLELGVDLTYDNHKFIYLMIHTNKSDIIEFLIENQHLKIDDLLIIQITAKSVFIDIVKLLVKYGADINAIDNNGKTLYYKTIMSGDFHVSKFLADNGAIVSNLESIDYLQLFRKFSEASQWLSSHPDKKFCEEIDQKICAGQKIYKVITFSQKN